MNSHVTDDFIVAIAGAAPCAADTRQAVSSPLFAYQIATDRISSTDHPAPVASAEQAPTTGNSASTVHHADGPHRPWRECELSDKSKPAPAAIAPVGALRIVKAGIDAMVRARQRFPVFLPKPLT